MVMGMLMQEQRQERREEIKSNSGKCYTRISRGSLVQNLFSSQFFLSSSSIAATSSFRCCCLR